MRENSDTFYAKEPNFKVCLQNLRQIIMKIMHFDTSIASKQVLEDLMSPLQDQQVKDYAKYSGYGDWRFEFLLRLKGYYLV